MAEYLGKLSTVKPGKIKWLVIDPEILVKLVGKTQNVDVFNQPFATSRLMTSG